MSDPFLFIAGHPCLDFLNTEKRNDAGERVELLTAPERLGDWFVEAGFSKIAADEALMWEARHLRDDIRGLVSAATSGAGLPAYALERLNVLLATGASWMRLTPELAEASEPVTARHPLLPIAEATRELLAHHDLSLVRSCGRVGCVLWFLDTTKNKQRRWCRMSTCGNRVKAAAHYRRQHGD